MPKNKKIKLLGPWPYPPSWILALPPDAEIKKNVQISFFSCNNLLKYPLKLQYFTLFTSRYVMKSEKTKPITPLPPPQKSHPLTSSGWLS